MRIAKIPKLRSGAASLEYAAPTGLTFCLGCASTKMARRRRWGGVVSALCAECRDVRNGTLQTATGTVALPIPIVAADVSPLIIPARGKFEPTHVGCYGIPNSAGATCRAVAQRRRTATLFLNSF